MAATPRHLPLLLAAVGVALCGSSCTSFRESAKDRNSLRDALYLYQLARPGALSGRLQRDLHTVNGDTVSVRTFPLLSPRSIVSAAAIETRDGRAAVKVLLDSHGRFLLLQLCASHAGTHVAVVVDDICRFSMRIPRKPDGPSALIVRGDWTMEEAQSVASRAAKNYRIANNLR